MYLPDCNKSNLNISIYLIANTNNLQIQVRETLNSKVFVYHEGAIGKSKRLDDADPSCWCDEQRSKDVSMLAMKSLYYRQRKIFLVKVMGA